MEAKGPSFIQLEDYSTQCMGHEKFLINGAVVIYHFVFEDLIF